MCCAVRAVGAVSGKTYVGIGGWKQRLSEELRRELSLLQVVAAMAQQQEGLAVEVGSWG